VNPSKGSQNREPLRGGVRRTAPKLISLANNYFDHRASPIPCTDSSPTDAKVKPFGVPRQSRGFTSLNYVAVFAAMCALSQFGSLYQAILVVGVISACSRRDGNGVHDMAAGKI
jgi:hypothetical protein